MYSINIIGVGKNVFVLEKVYYFVCIGKNTQFMIDGNNVCFLLLSEI